MNKIILSVVSAGIGAAISWFLTKKVYEKKLDTLAEATTEEVRFMNEQLNDLHRVFVEEQPVEIAGERQKTWDNIARKSGSTVGRSDEDVVKEFREGILNARKMKEEKEKDLTRYAVEVASYAVEPVNPDIYEGPSIYAITTLEYYEGDAGYLKEELNLWMLEEMLYDEYEEVIDGPKGLIGLTLEELLEQVPIITESDDEDDIKEKGYLYFRNENIKTDYEVRIMREGYSPYFYNSSEN